MKRSCVPREDHGTGPCPVCDATPVVLVAPQHPVMRRWTEVLLESEHGCWDVTQMVDGELLAGAIARICPDLVVDESNFPTCAFTADPGAHLHPTTARS